MYICIYGSCLRHHSSSRILDLHCTANHAFPVLVLAAASCDACGFSRLLHESQALSARNVYNTTITVLHIVCICCFNMYNDWLMLLFISIDALLHCVWSKWTCKQCAPTATFCYWPLFVCVNLVYVLVPVNLSLSFMLPYILAQDVNVFVLYIISCIELRFCRQIRLFSYLPASWW